MYPINEMARFRRVFLIGFSSGTRSARLRALTQTAAFTAIAPPSV
jgi:poly(3-hydroxybutyrate) depolymerase